MKNVQNTPGSYGFLAGAYFFLLVLVLYMMSGCAGSVYRLTRVALEKMPYSVSITKFCMGLDGPSVSFGSGVMISGNELLTAGHVVKCSGFATYVVDAGPAHIAATLDRIWPERDIARLMLFGHAPYYAPKVVTVAPNQNVCQAAKVPREMASCGPVISVERTTCEDDGEWCYNAGFRATVIPGNSGAPVYNESGELVALVTGTNPYLGVGYMTVLYGVDIYGR
jgi:hypothetical protein